MYVQICHEQYALVKNSRQALFQFLLTLKATDLEEKLQSFGGRNINYILTHVANTYLYWIEQIGREAEVSFYKEDDSATLKDLVSIYGNINSIVDVFLSRHQNWDESLQRFIPSQKKEISITPLALFTHVITHEFHHKGQILSMCRQLGYIPVDTDIIRFN